MIVGRIVGWIFLLAAIAVFSWDVVAVIITGDLVLTSGADVWAMADPADPLPRLAPWLRDYVVGPLFAAPAALVFLVVGLLLLVLFRRRRRRSHAEPAYE